MNEGETGSARARLRDLLRPSQLYRGIEVRPTFIRPTLVLVACAVAYGMSALGPAMPRVLPGLLERSVSTESELARAFSLLILFASILLPGLFVAGTALTSWALLRAARAKCPLPLVFSLVAHASLWAALGLLAKAFLVAASGKPEPPVNLSLLVRAGGAWGRVLLAFTNPFALLGLAWTVRGLRSWGIRRAAAGIAGAGPWVAWIVLLAVGSGGGARLAPTGPVPYENWGSIERGSILLRHPPGLEKEAEDLATILDGFTRKLSEHFGFEPFPIRVHAFPDHATLERACGEFLHARVTGSIRGRDLLFVEMPGRTPAMTREAGWREAMRYAALMQLAIAPGTRAAPRWYVEGLCHAAVRPPSPELTREFQAMLRRSGVPALKALEEARIFQTPQGPLFARSLVDFLAARFGEEVLETLCDDLAAGGTFRDALYARTRLTLSALEAQWRESLFQVLRDAEPSTRADSTGAPETIVPFRSPR